MCIWLLQKPGVTTISRASITRSAVTCCKAVALPTWTMRCPSIRIEPSWIMRRSGSTVTMKRAPSILRVVICPTSEHLHDLENHLIERLPGRHERQTLLIRRHKFNEVGMPMRERTPQHRGQVSRLGDAIHTIGVKTITPGQ